MSKLACGLIFGIGILLLLGQIFSIDSRRSWNEVKDIPLVAAMGHWDKTPYQKAFPLKSEVFPAEISKDKWVEIVEVNGFRIFEKDGHCDVSIYAVDFLQNYDTCGWRKVGPNDCSYSYYIAANFESNKMSEVVGVRGAFICM